MDAPEKITGLSLEWTGRHHSPQGDFADLSTHTVTYETDTTAYITGPNDELLGNATYEYQRLDDQVGVCIYRPEVWQGRTDVILRSVFDFHAMTDRAVVTASERPFAAAEGNMRSVPRPPKPE